MKIEIEIEDNNGLVSVTFKASGKATPRIARIVNSIGDDLKKICQTEVKNQMEIEGETFILKRN